jgi:superoxide dismutase, Fe-Mn family
MAFELPNLPYAKDALAPHISANTLDFHHGKHHAGYVAKLNDLAKGSRYDGKSLEEIIKAADPQAEAGFFNNAAQVWNHTFFWHCMKPNGGGAPTGELADKINAAFGSVDKFKQELKDAALAQFGSGWAWLVVADGKLQVTKTPNAVNPLSLGQAALFTVDVWEHAYYLDYQNRRPDFVGAVLDHLLNWDFVAENLKAAK